jgi:general secretion pathway protein E
MKDLVDELVGLAVDAGCAHPEKCREAVAHALAAQQSPVAAVLDGGFAPEPVFLKRLAESLDLEWRDEQMVRPMANAREKFPARLALGHSLLPEEPQEDGEMCVAVFDPFDHAGWQALTRHWPGPVRLAVTTRRRVSELLKSTYGVGAVTFDELLEDRDPAETVAAAEEVNVLDDEDPEASVMKFVNQILREGLQQKATDIHFEPLGQNLRIRYRIDGVLHETPVPPRIKMLQDSVISRLKIMAGLDIAEKRLPQDGRIALEHAARQIDVRVATIPCVHGENVSLRLLGQETFDLHKLGLDPSAEAAVRTLISAPNGIVLVTGPTGCGKSTTLYTFMSCLNVTERRIVTIEDPVEHKLEGIMQIAVKPEINLTFANALRSILRGDPNVIMVGEMRDSETAEIAIRAALTGHLVFSTLHTNDAVGGITRLLDMNIEPFLVGSTVRAFIAQRLVRRLCKHCAEPARRDHAELAALGFPMEWADQIFKPVGCDQCRQSGYAGRAALFEMCLVTPRIQELMQKRASGTELFDLALREGMVPLRRDGWRKVASGLTSVEEVLRVTTRDVSLLDE